MIGTASFDDEEDHSMRKLLQECVTLRFGPLCPAALKKLASLPPESLKDWFETVLTALSLQELGLDEAILNRKE